MPLSRRMRSPFAVRRPRLGMYGRVMVGHYLWHVQVAFLALTGVITAINISPEIGRVWREFALSGGTASAVGHVARYVFYRLLDNGAQIFPVAFVLAIVWAEIEHALTGRQTMVRTAGMSFRRGVTALGVVAALSVPAQFLLDNFVRPYAFMGLSIGGLGEYGWKYSRERGARVEWLSLNGDVVQVKLRDDPLPRMSDITFYQFSSGGELIRMTDARSVVARPGQAGAWRFVDARVWDFAGEGDDAQSGTSVGYLTYPTLDIDLPLSPLWLEYRGIAAKYVPLADLAALAMEPSVPDDAPRYGVWLQVRLAQALNPGLIALCLTGVFFILLDRFGLSIAAAVMLLAGYVGFTLTRVIAVIADHGVLPGALAAWLLPGLFLASAVVLFGLIRRRDRHYEQMADRMPLPARRFPG